MRNGELPAEQAIPVCSSPATINAGFELLVALAVGCVRNLKQIVESLTEMYYIGTAITSKYSRMLWWQRTQILFSWFCHNHLQPGFSLSSWFSLTFLANECIIWDHGKWGGRLNVKVFKCLLTAFLGVVSLLSKINFMPLKSRMKPKLQSDT